MSTESVPSIVAHKMAGLSYRQLDYLVSAGVIRPAVQDGHGPGNPRLWAPEQLRILRLLAVLRDLGASHDAVCAAARQAEQLADGAWSSRILVAADGRISTLLGGDSDGYVVDLAACEMHVRSRQSTPAAV